MQVILLERVEKLGIMGETVTVKPGYARNYLLPQKKALRATKDSIAYFEAQKATLEANNIKRRDEAQKVADRMEGASVTLIRQASEMGFLYGSVRGKDISELLVAKGFVVDRNQVKLSAPIKTLGQHTAQVVLHPEVSVDVALLIAQSAEEAAAHEAAAEELSAEEAIAKEIG